LVNCGKHLSLDPKIGQYDAFYIGSVA